MNPKVSYFMPTIRSQFIQETIASVQGQILTDWELIIADKNNVLPNGIDDSRIKIFDGSRMMEGDIVEKALSMAFSDIILTIHDDNIDLPHRAQFLYDQMNETKADIIVASYKTINEKGQPGGPVIFNDPFDIRQYLYHGQNMALFSGAYRKSTTPAWRKSFYVLGDYCFFMDSYIRGLKILRSPEIVTHERQWPGQMNKTSSDIRLKVWWDAERYQFYQTYGVWVNR